MPIQTISREELQAWREAGREFMLVDTSLADDFAAAHLPGAQNACVFEVSFLSQVGALEGLNPGVLTRAVGGDPRHDVPVVVYGASERSLASRTAAEKLLAAGFTDVREFRGGLEEWRGAGLPIEGEGTRPIPPLEDRDYAVDPKESSVEWAGRSIIGSKHFGTLDLLPGGQITLRAGRLAGGSFALDMASIANQDLSNPLMRKTLHDHLKSDDFFDVERFPQAQFFLDGAEEIPGAPPGSPNYLVKGRLWLKGVEKPIEFPAQVGRPPEGGGLVSRAHFDFDRTEWNVLYGSGKFYERLGKHLVSDRISMDLKIVAR